MGFKKKKVQKNKSSYLSEYGIMVVRELWGLVHGGSIPSTQTRYGGLAQMDRARNF